MDKVCNLRFRRGCFGMFLSYILGGKGAYSYTTGRKNRLWGNLSCDHDLGSGGLPISQSLYTILMHVSVAPDGKYPSSR